MPSVTPAPHPFAAFDGLLDLEKSRAFHSGRRALGLECMEAIVRELVLGWGPHAWPALCVHVAGSEGKTSVTERLAAGLSATGRRTGAYTSPHLRDPRERMRVDGALPDDAVLRPAVEAVLDAARRSGEEPSWFEAVTATAAALFAGQGLDAAVWETGLGGRLDATRALPAQLCVITTISLEHTAVLGDTLEAVAREKAGILRPGAPVVVGAGVPPAARAVVLAEAERLGCPARVVGTEDGGVPADGSGARDAAPDPVDANRRIARAAFEGLVEHGLLPAAALPAALAAAGAHAVEGRADLRDGVLYDGAHTVAAARALAARLGAAPAGPVVMGVTSGRDAVAMARALLPVARPLVLTRAPGPRGVDPAALLEALLPAAAAPDDALRRAVLARTVLEPDPRAALARAREERADPSIGITVTGSLHLVGLLLPPRDRTP